MLYVHHCLLCDKLQDESYQVYETYQVLQLFDGTLSPML